MAAGKLQNVLSRVTSVMAGQDQGSPDRELLSRFLVDREEAAFAALMERHGAMVLGVCRRVLRNAQDAEDACQAAFLVLARKASAVRKQGSLASWLHGVAWRVARKLQAQLARRRNRDASRAATQPTVCDPPDVSLREACRILDEELNRLPPNYKAPLVLCHLEGRTQDEAARELGWTLGTVRGRLERGRERLRVRLLRRGVTGAAVLTATALGANLGSAAVPPTLAVATLKASLTMAAGKSVASAVPPAVTTLTEQVLHGLIMAKLKLVAAACSGLAALVLIAAWSAGLFPWNTHVSAEAEKLEAWSSVRRLEIPKSRVWCVAFSPDGKRIAAGAGGMLLPEVRIRQTAPGKAVALWNRPFGKLHLWDAATGKLVYALDTAAAVRCVAFSPDGKILATAEHDGAARLRNADTGKVLFLLLGHGSNVDCVVFSADGKSLATSSWDGTVKIWDTGSGANVQMLGANTRQLFTVAFGSEGKLASGGADGKTRIWQADNGKPRHTLRGHSAAVHGLAFSPDGKLLASASWDKTVKLWDTTTWKPVATLEGHADPVLALAFAHDGKMLASSSGSWGTDEIMKSGPTPGDVVLWDLTARKPRAHMRYPDRILGVAFSPDSKTVASAGWDGFVTLWRPEPSAAAAPQTPGPQQGPQAIVENNGDLKFVRTPESAVNEPAPKKNYAQDFQCALTDKKADGLVPYGPDAAECLKFEPDGLHITLPAGYPRKRPGTGLVTDFGVGGDFEITVSFELPKKDEAFQGGPPAELRLVIVPHEPAEADVWHKADQNRASLARQTAGPNNPSQFLTCSATWNPASVKDKWGNEIFHNKERLTIDEFPTEVASGRLRLVRSGSAFYFYAGEGADGDFRLLHTQEFGRKDVKNVRIVASTPGPWSSFDARVTDLHIRADALPQILAANQDPAAFMQWPAILFISSAVLALLSLAGWFYVRRSRRPAKGHGGDISVRKSIIFPCSGCGKRLKTRPELAGKKVKCPQCSKAVDVPQSQALDAKDLS